MGYHPAAASDWVAQRHAAGRGAHGEPPPALHFRREADGAVWLSLAMATNAAAEQQPGGAYLPAALADYADAAEWTTFYPMDEHGCRWHVRGEEGDSTRRVHGSPAPQWVVAAEVEAVGADFE